MADGNTEPPATQALSKPSDLSPVAVSSDMRDLGTHSISTARAVSQSEINVIIEAIAHCCFHAELAVDASCCLYVRAKGK